MFYKPEREHIRNIDDIIYGYKKEKPQKGRFWLLFLIAFILAFAFNFFFNVITTKAQVVYPIFSQQNGSASTTFAGALPILQTNFNLSEASSTISSLTFRLQYNSGNWIGRQHKVCIGEMILDDPSWYLYYNNLRCFSRQVDISDFDNLPHDFKFIGSQIILNSSLFYAFIDIGLATSTSRYAILNSDVEIGDITYYGSNTNVYGGETLASSVATYWAIYTGNDERSPIGNSPLPIPANNGQNFYDMFFIVNGVFSGGIGGVPPESCEGGGFFDTLLCNLYVSLLIPSNDALLQFDGLFDTIANKPPFGYFTQIKNAISNLGVGTTTLAFAGVSQLGIIFNPIRTALTFALWFLFTLWVFHRIRLFDFF